jgi:ribosome maturation factor RimP
VEHELFGLLASRVAELDLDLVDVEVLTGKVRVIVDRSGGADIDSIAAASRTVSDVLDHHDPQPGHRYTLEVTTPGVERPLRSPGSFARAVGETVSVRTVGGGEGERRFQGVLSRADDEGFVLKSESSPSGERWFSYDQIERARTVFEWPAPGRPNHSHGARAQRKGPGRKGPRAATEKVTNP